MKEGQEWQEGKRGGAIGVRRMQDKESRKEKGACGVQIRYDWDFNVLPSSGLECFAIIRIAKFCHLQVWNVLP